MRGQKILRDLERYVRLNRSKAVVAFVQFQSMTGKEKFYKNASLKWWQKLCQAKKFKHLKYVSNHYAYPYRFKGRYLDVQIAPEPDVIIWENQHIGNVERTIRTGIVTVITIALVILSFAGIIIAEYYQD